MGNYSHPAAGCEDHYTGYGYTEVVRYLVITTMVSLVCSTPVIGFSERAPGGTKWNTHWIYIGG